ncbi:MAG: flagellar biosynthesis protein FlhF [Pseudomonadota bacterium]
MNVKKFTAATARDALRKVREALGPDAVILSNRPVDGVVEILALASDDAASVSSPAHGSDMAQPRPSLDLAPESYANRRPADPYSPPADRFDMAQMSSMMSAAIAQAKDSAAAEMSGMMSEIRAMRGLMETQLAELSWNTTQQREPQKAGVLREMLAAGFSVSLARYLIEKLPAGKDAADSLRWIKTVLTRNMNTMANEDDILEKGGVFALVGPTGVGKTTSTAKLAARCVMRHGPEKLALITTDAYRIGGHEQLRIYGKILGVMVHSVKDEADLRIALKELRNKHTVLIDTVGVSQRDQMVTEQVAMLSETGADVQRLLCLNATSTNETLSEVVRAYQGSGLAGCIMTKLDEAASIGNVLDVVIRQKLNLYYVSNGQRVPEDLHLADRGMLVDRAFRLKRDTATQYSDAELPLLMAGAAHARNDRTLREVSLG